ncbi:MAG TPA: hypothetical protein VMV45_20160 [Casimicrobiaceae bacterium]|nr:hypothetical protein [Casimicrobiaceae bacterium]
MKTTLASVLLALFCGAAHATTLTVTNTTDSGPGSLRNAIAEANFGGGPNTVNIIVTGTIVLTSGSIQIASPLTIVGPGADKLTIDGNAKSNIFTVFVTDPACPAQDGPDYLVSISGLRLTNGLRDGRSGGAIFSEHSLLLDAVLIDKNVAGIGGGAMVQFQYPGQTLTITNSQFLNNTARPVTTNPSVTDSGGALLLEQKCANTRFTPASASISNSVFSGNRAQPTTLSAIGGAVGAFAYVDYTISDTRIVDNHVDVPNPPLAGRLYRGGGISFGNVKSATIVRSEISNNSTIDATSGGVTQGGGLVLVNAAPDLQAPSSATAVNIINSKIVGNADSALGGGIYVYGNVAVNVDSSTISNNTAPTTKTGGIFLTTGPTAPASAANAAPPTLAFASSTVANNTTYDIATSVIPALAVYASNSQTGTICSTCNISVVNGPAPLVPQVGLWWNPNESGSGYSFDVKHNTLVVTIYSYTGTGASQWYLSSAPLSADGTTFTGTLDKYVNGQCISCAYQGRPALVGSDGNITVKFNSATSATVTLPGGRVTQIQPQAF